MITPRFWLDDSNVNGSGNIIHALTIVFAIVSNDVASGYHVLVQCGDASHQSWHLKRCQFGDMNQHVSIYISVLPAYMQS